MLQVRNVSKHFRGVRALDSVSLELGAGEIVAVVGDNGAGKSTLMKCISGVLNPDSGSISFGEVSLTNADPAVARLAGIEMIYQDLGLCLLQDVTKNIFLGREKKRGPFLDTRSMEKDSERVLSELGANVPLRTAVTNLSGGQRQAVSIARAMLTNPKILIMDEPTAALATGGSKKVLDYARNVKVRGVSVIIITHNLADAINVSDRILVMRRGTVAFETSPAETDVKHLAEKMVAE